GVPGAGEKVVDIGLREVALDQIIERPNISVLSPFAEPDDVLPVDVRVHSFADKRSHRSLPKLRIAQYLQVHVNAGLLFEFWQQRLDRLVSADRADRYRSG